MKEIRARVILQERGLYRIATEQGEKWAEVSGKYRHQASVASDYPAVGDYCLALWPEDESNAIITMLFPRKSCFVRKADGDSYLREKNEKFKQIAKINRANKR